MRLCWRRRTRSPPSRPRSQWAWTRSSSTFSTSSAGPSCWLTRTTSTRSVTALPPGRCATVRSPSCARSLRRCPTLDEALAFFADRPEVAVHVDLKLTERLDELAAALERHDLVGRTVVSSFHRESLRAVARAVPGVRIGVTYPEDRRGIARRRILHPAIRLGTVALRAALPRRVPAMLASAGANALMLHQAVVSAETVAAAHDSRRRRLDLDDRSARGARGDDRGGGRRGDHERPQNLRSDEYRHGYTRPVKRGFAALSLLSCAVAGLLSALVLVAAPGVIAQTVTTGTTTAPERPGRSRRRRPRSRRRPPPRRVPTTTTTPKPPPPPRPTTIPAGVTIAGLLVGGLSPAFATAEVRAFFARSLTVRSQPRSCSSRRRRSARRPMSAMPSSARESRDPAPTCR